MFTIDERLRGLPATRDQIVSFHQSLNSPHLAIPGKPAGVAQAFVVGLRGQSGYGIFVYLFLPEALDCAVYVPESHWNPADAVEGLESDALAFVESMGFMMDNAHFSTLPEAQQRQMLATLPVFLKDPRLSAHASGAKARQDEKRTATSHLGRLLAAF